MKQLGMCAGLFAAGLLALAPRGGSQASPTPQQPQEPSSQEPGIRREVGLVNIFATVRNKNKRIVTGLKKEDFKILEDNTEQKIAFFSAESALPITIGMLIDTSGSEERMIGEVAILVALDGNRVAELLRAELLRYALHERTYLVNSAVGDLG